MTEHDTLLSEVEDYCKRMNIQPSTLAVRALGNSRFFDRHARRIEKFEADKQKLRDFMAENPPSHSSEDAA